MTDLLYLVILLQSPPPGIAFALQVGKGNDYTCEQLQISAGADLRFTCTAVVKPDKNGNPDFFGPSIHGPAGERFIYIDIGTYARQKNTHWARRLKIPLRGITAETWSGLMAQGNPHLETRVPGTHKDGGPNCATVKPFMGWEAK